MASVLHRIFMKTNRIVKTNSGSTKHIQSAYKDLAQEMVRYHIKREYKVSFHCIMMGLKG